MLRVSLAIAIVLGGCRSVEDAPVRVAAASDTARAFDALARREHLDVRFTLGSSGLLARQLAQGAPFDVFVSADVRLVDDVVDAGACDATTRRVWAHGRVAVVTRKGLAVPKAVSELADARFTRIALANPEHAPFGKAAVQALASAHILDAVRPRLVPAENVLQALQFVDTGNAEAGLVALSLLSPDRDLLRVDEAEHEPLELGVVLCAKPERRAKAQAFVDALTSPEAAALLAGFGYEAPAGGPPR